MNSALMLRATSMQMKKRRLCLILNIQQRLHASKGYWTMSGEYTHRHHNVPRDSYYASQEFKNVLTVAILAHATVLPRKWHCDASLDGPRCSRAFGAHACNLADRPLLARRPLLRRAQCCIEEHIACAQQQATETADEPWTSRSTVCDTLRLSSVSN